MKLVKIARKTELKVKTILRAVFTWFFGQSMIQSHLYKKIKSFLIEVCIGLQRKIDRVGYKE